jgi:integrase
MNAKFESGLSPRTVQYLRAVLRRALGQAPKWDLVARNVATLVEPPRSVKHEIHPFTPKQAQAFLTAVKGDRLEALYSVAIALGLRQGEALGLRWSDIDFDAGTLTVRVALHRIGGEPVLTEPKTNKSRRTVHMPPSFVASLREHRIRQLEERLMMEPRWDDSWNLVFASTIGTPLDARNVVRHFKAALVKANMPDLRLHDLRHTCASLLLAQGVGPRTIVEVLGHSQISLTMDTYSHVMPEMRREAAELMERLLSTNSTHFTVAHSSTPNN